MSWTLKKINECDEIKFGTVMEFTGEDEERRVVNNGFMGFKTISDGLVFTWGEENKDITDMQFYRPDGTEILPPKDDVIETLYECLDEYGDCSYYFSCGSKPLFGSKRKNSYVDKESLTRKTGRTLKLNMTTWEIVKEEIK